MFSTPPKPLICSCSILGVFLLYYIISQSPENKAMSRGDEATSRGDEATSRDDEATSRGDEAMSRDDEAMSRGDEAMSRGDEATSRGDEAMSRGDEATSRDGDVSRDDDVSIQTVDILNGRGKMCIFYTGQVKLTYRAGLKLLKESKEFRDQVKTTILAAGYSAVFWEFPPISQSTFPNFEFVVMNAPSLARVPADMHAFEDYFERDRTVVTFPNLGRDAQMVVPCPVTKGANYAHLAAYLASATEHEVDEMLRTTAAEMEHALEKSKRVVWLSTSGMGVYYLHVRLDSRPKYYTYTPYKSEGYSNV